jgi:hypothetical protein
MSRQIAANVPLKTSKECVFKFLKGGQTKPFAIKKKQLLRLLRNE